MIWLKAIVLCIAIIIFCIVSAIVTLIAWGIVTVINIIKEE
jgi:hypothetical protein